LQNDVVQRLPGGMAFTAAPVAGGVALNTGVQVTVAWADVQRTQANQPGTDQACIDAGVDVNLPGPAAVTNTYRCYSAFVYP